MHMEIMLQRDLTPLMNTGTVYSKLHFVFYCKDKKMAVHERTVKLN